MNKSSPLILILVVGAVLLLAPEALHAYGGPGSIVSGLGAFLAVIAAVAAAVVGFFWFPLKRLIQKIRGGRKDEEGDVAEAS